MRMSYSIYCLGTVRNGNTFSRPGPERNTGSAGGNDKPMIQGSAIVNISSTCNGVNNMSRMIQIRHVPDDIHKILKIRAVEKSMSLSEYLLRELTRMVKRPTLDDVMERIEKRALVDIEESSVDAVRAERQAR